jgi:hypothetical protein
MKKRFGLSQLEEARSWAVLFEASWTTMDRSIMVPRNTWFNNTLTQSITPNDKNLDPCYTALLVPCVRYLENHVFLGNIIGRPIPAFDVLNSTKAQLATCFGCTRVAPPRDRHCGAPEVARCDTTRRVLLFRLVFFGGLVIIQWHCL